MTLRRFALVPVLEPHFFVFRGGIPSQAEPQPRV